jgi:ATP-binding cassette subfamily B multidrug efflux pump
LTPSRPTTPPTPAADVWRFLLTELRPLRPVVVAAVASTILCAAIEVSLIGYAVFVLLCRPAIHLVSEALDDIAFRANAR